jgi:hypothetical protein
MALSGSLLDFGFTDILQLVKMQRKGGRLAVTSREQQVVMWFGEGDLVFAQDEGRPLTAVVGRALEAEGLVRAGPWRKAVEVQREKGGDLAGLLPDLDSARLEALAADYVRETVYGVFRWLEGDYTFDADLELPPGVPAVPLGPIDTDDLMMEAAARAATWQELDTALPSWRAILAVAGSDLGPEGAESDASRPPDQRHVLGLLDRRRDVRAVVAASRLGALETCQALAALQAAGRIRVVGETAQRPMEPAPAHSTPRRKARGLRRGTAWRAALVTAGCGGAMLLTGWLAYQRVAGEARPGLAALAASTAPYRDHQVRQALRVYRLTHGAYPDDLGALREAGLVGEGVIDPAMHYSRAGDGFILSSG